MDPPQGGAVLVLAAAREPQLLRLQLKGDLGQLLGGVRLLAAARQPREQRDVERARAAQARADRRIRPRQDLDAPGDRQHVERRLVQVQLAVVPDETGVGHGDPLAEVLGPQPDGAAAQEEVDVHRQGDGSVHHRAALGVGERGDVGPPPGPIDPQRRAGADDHGSPGPSRMRHAAMSASSPRRSGAGATTRRFAPWTPRA